MKKHLIFFLFSLVLAASLQNCKYARIDSIVNNSSEVGFTTINAKGRIIDYKDGTPTAHGHCYSDTDEIPEIGLPKTDTTETPYVDVDFESKIDSLIFDKAYFVRPYMRNGNKVVYGEVQKITTKTPSVIISEFKIARIPRTSSVQDSVLFIKAITNEPLKVLQLPNNVNGREYGFVFGKEDTLRVDNGFPTTGTRVFDIRFVSANNITTNVRELKLDITLNNPLPALGIPTNFFSVPDPSANITPTVYSARAYLKLNRGGVPKYYYSESIKFRIK